MTKYKTAFESSFSSLLNDILITRFIQKKSALEKVCTPGTKSGVFRYITEETYQKSGINNIKSYHNEINNMEDKF